LSLAALLPHSGSRQNLRELALVTRSKSNTSTVAGQNHPATLTSLDRVSQRFDVPRRLVIKAVSNEKDRCPSQEHRSSDHKTPTGPDSQERGYAYVTP
jgi:hypothetical protein